MEGNLKQHHTTKPYTQILYLAVLQQYTASIRLEEDLHVTMIN